MPAKTMINLVQELSLIENPLRTVVAASQWKRVKLHPLGVGNRAKEGSEVEFGSVSESRWVPSEPQLKLWVEALRRLRNL